MKKIKWKTDGKTRLDSFLRTMIPSSLSLDVSNSKIRRLIMAGCVTVNGAQCRIPAFVMGKGDSIEVFIDEEKFLYEKKPQDIDFVLTQKDVVYEDDYLIVVNKPAFLPAEETIVEGRKNLHGCVVDYLWAKNPSLRNPPYAGIMHRLDRETSGSILFTKQRSVNKRISEMFQTREIKKVYRAVAECVRGKRSPGKSGEFIVEEYIGRVSPKSSGCKMGVVPESRGGQYSHTRFVVVQEKDGLCYVDCHLKTGRTHQIRLHLSLENMPICGDELYGGSKGFSELGNRIMLHSMYLEFEHPVTGQLVKAQSPLPSPLFGEPS
ncbi:MAG: RluA family pseudouridine synthase [Treponema sp.]|nr:RluA family pseudouridine synthase [Treponema sp.]